MRDLSPNEVREIYAVREELEVMAVRILPFGIRSYANALPEALDQARRDHVDMILALLNSSRDDLIALARRHLKPSPQAYIRAYERRFGRRPNLTE